MIQTRSKPDRSAIFVELNEAERHFLDRFVAEGRLPNFARMLQGGAIVRTRVPGFDPSVEKAWRLISPWIVWPSIYTGLTPTEHGLVGFGQDTSSIRGRCTWDVLDAHGISVGVLGSLMSFPPRTSGTASYYVPESLADTADCFPPEARPLQEFCVFSARNYSESFSLRAATAVKLLLKTGASGVRTGTMLRTLRQMPAEALRGPAMVPERAMLHSYLVRDAFMKLYGRFRPSFATVHMNHVAYMQHRYWRAAEPDRFQAQLSTTDRRFFDTVPEREAYEERFSRWILKSFEWTDAFLGELMAMTDERTVILVGTALGQRPFDPTKDIHNPVVRLVHEDELFRAIGLPAHVVLHQMNPDVTVNFATESAASEGADKLRGLCIAPDEPLFTVQQRGAQVFLELDMPKRMSDGQTFTIGHRTMPEIAIDFARHIREHETNDQSTAHHKDSGWLLAYSKGARVNASADVVRVTDVAPSVLALFDLPPQSWMPQDAGLAFTVGS